MNSLRTKGNSLPNYNQAVQTYQQVAKNTSSPRELESSLLSRAAGNLQRVKDNWENDPNALRSALKFNRQIWTVLVSSVARDDSPLPTELRQNVANLGVFILGQTVELELNPQQGKLDTLININRELSVGLRAVKDAA